MRRLGAGRCGTGPAQARRVTKTGFPAVTVYDGLRPETTARWLSGPGRADAVRVGPDRGLNPLRTTAGRTHPDQAGSHEIECVALATLTVLLSTYRKDR
jgi:hypothetical protein